MRKMWNHDDKVISVLLRRAPRRTRSHRSGALLSVLVIGGFVLLAFLLGLYSGLELDRLN